MDNVTMLLIGFIILIVLLVLSIALSMRIQRIRLVKMGMQVKHDLTRIEREVDSVKRVLPGLVDREKLAIEKEGLKREISAVESKMGQEERKFDKLNKALEVDKKTDKAIMRNVSKLEKALEKMKARLNPKKKKLKRIKRGKKK